MPKLKTATVFFILLACAHGQWAYAKCQSLPPNRFELHGALVYDAQTSLTWMRCSVGQSWSDKQGCSGSEPALMSLHDARAAAVRAGNGWRVPDAKELLSLVEHKCASSTIDSRVFPGVKDLGDGIPYWTNSPATELMPMKMNYFVDFSDGRVDAHTPGFPLAVRLVRSGRTK